MGTPWSPRLFFAEPRLPRLITTDGLLPELAAAAGLDGLIAIVLPM